MKSCKQISKSAQSARSWSWPTGLTHLAQNRTRDSPSEPELDLNDTDEVTTKLDLARAYVDMGDAEGAKNILEEVVTEGSDDQKQQAMELLGVLTA